MIRINYWLTFSLLAFITSSQPSLATEKPDESVSITLAGQLEAPVQRFGQAKQRILWLSDQATQEADSTLAKALANAGFEVWLTPLQATAKQEKTSKPLNSAAIAELIEESIPSKPEDKLYVFSTGNSAKATVDGLKIWQDARGRSAQLGGLILAYPHLQTEKSTSKHPEFIEASTQLKLPIYIFQPANKLKVAVAENLVATLEQGGSVVYSELVEDAGDGYLQNQSHSEEETLQLSLFPAKLAQALEKLTEATTQPQAAATSAETTDELQEHPTKELAPDLKLIDLEGKTHDLKDYRGKVVLLNFWATWCPPCIKEIPSISNLQKKFSSNDFVVLSVDVGEEPKDVKAFLKHVPADYPVLLDSESSLASTWQLKAFPSTFIIDRTGHLRYIYFGGLEWDRPEITKFLEKNLEIVAE